MDKFIYIRLFAGLNFFVPKRLKQRTIQLPLYKNQSVKDLIESVGVPHTEFEMVVVNGDIVNLSYHVNENDHISVYPRFFQLENPKCQEMGLKRPKEFKFILDVHLGKLNAMLRMLGFDCYYRNNLDDDEIIDIACNENRIVLSRDLGIFKNGKVKWGYFPRSQDPKIQLKEIIERYDLKNKIRPFSRCINCNGEIKIVNKDHIPGDLEGKTKLYYHDFYACTNCKKTYWKGSHYHKMMEFIENISQN
jgi:uncharacterized protein with PIN domain/sulfur carrier protein ThiS